MVYSKNNGDADWADLHWPNGDATKASTDAAPFQCKHAPLPAVVVPGA